MLLPMVLGIKLVTALLLGGAATAVAVGVAGLVYDWVRERITRATVREHFAKKIQEALANGDYTTVNIGLTEAEVIDVSEKDGETYVAYEVDGKKYGIRSAEGTSLSERETLELSV